MRRERTSAFRLSRRRSRRARSATSAGRQVALRPLLHRLLRPSPSAVRKADLYSSRESRRWAGVAVSQRRMIWPCSELVLPSAARHGVGGVQQAGVVEHALRTGAGEELGRLETGLDVEAALDVGEEAVAVAAGMVPGEAGGQRCRRASISSTAPESEVSASVTARTSTARARRSSRRQPSVRTAARASAISSLAVRSSMVSKCGATPASSGKRLSSAWQSAWIVMMPRPRGRSSTRAKRRRASRRVRGEGGSPVSSSISAASAFSSRATAHAASWRSIRAPIRRRRPW